MRTYGELSDAEKDRSATAAAPGATCSGSSTVTGTEPRLEIDKQLRIEGVNLMRVIAVSLMTILVTAVPAWSEAASRPAFDLATAELVDLSHPFDASTIYWPTDTKGFRLESLHFGPTPGGFFYAANSISTAEHGGTHLDAPIHFAEGSAAVDRGAARSARRAGGGDRRSREGDRPIPTTA